MTVVCPKCGQMESRQITPVLFECEAEVQTGWFDAPPEVTGMGFERHATYGPCGHRFQVGGENAPPCEVPGCGRDSVGTCQGPCGRRLCGLCGAPRGSFMCASCVKANAAEQHRITRERQEAEERRREEQARELTERRRVADEELAHASGPEEIIDVLERQAELVSKEVCEAAWLRLLESTATVPAHEIATVKGRGHFLICGWQGDPGWNWHERGKREDAWFAPESNTYLDRKGWTWQPCSGLLLGEPNPFMSGEKNWVGLPRGARFRTLIGLHYWGLILLPNAPGRTPAIGHSLSRFELPGHRYAAAMAEILRS
jgi:hypothetical protein